MNYKSGKNYMNGNLKIITVITFLLIFNSSTGYGQHARLADKKASGATVALGDNLYYLAQNFILFGHQHAMEYGHGWSGDAERSDVKSVTGSNPAVVGIDISEITNVPALQSSYNQEKLRKEVVETNKRGGITTIAWHFSNPVSPGGFYWNDSLSVPAVKYIIPGGLYHEKYKEILRMIGRWAISLKDSSGNDIPVIFRPFHEMDGDWFWWGKAHCSKAEFKKLWQFTVRYLKKDCAVHNFIYAFSPDCKFENTADYLDRYPGDRWVDLLGMDDYADLGRDGYHLDNAVKKLKIVSDYAVKAKKLAAFTETGLESIPNATWWTQVLLRAIKGQGLKLSYVLVWRNDMHSPTHFYAPFPGQVSSDDFIRFYHDPYTLFESDIKTLGISSVAGNQYTGSQP